MCNATGKYDHEYKPCNKLPDIRCIGTPSQQELGKYQWDCQTTEKISGYNMRTVVLDDYKTIYVRLHPHVDLSPGAWLVCTLMLCSCILCICSMGDEDGGSFVYCPIGGGNDDGYNCTNIS
jgi:hypothetical protein